LAREVVRDTASSPDGERTEIELQKSEEPLATLH